MNRHPTLPMSQSQLSFLASRNSMAQLDNISTTWSNRNTNYLNDIYTIRFTTSFNNASIILILFYRQSYLFLWNFAIVVFTT